MVLIVEMKNFKGKSEKEKVVWLSEFVSYDPDFYFVTLNY